MDEADTAEDGSGWYQRLRRADGRVAVFIGTGDLGFCAYLLWMVLASAITFGAPDKYHQAEVHAAYQLAERLYFGWLAGGLLLLLVFLLPRSAITHLVFMVVPPAAFLVYLYGV